MIAIILGSNRAKDRNAIGTKEINDYYANGYARKTNANTNTNTNTNYTTNNNTAANNNYNTENNGNTQKLIK